MYIVRARIEQSNRYTHKMEEFFSQLFDCNAHQWLRLRSGVLEKQKKTAASTYFLLFQVLVQLFTHTLRDILLAQFITFSDKQHTTIEFKLN